jgi:hypothetical protein
MTNQQLAAICAERNICQIGIMCKDIEVKMKNLIEDFNLGPWDFYTHSENTLQNILIREGYCEPHFKFYCAVASVGNIQIELIQPVFGIPFYKNFLEKNGDAIHHFKEKVNPDKFDEILDAYEAKGMKRLFGASLFESRFCFVDSVDKYGFLLEIGNGQSPTSVPANWKKTIPLQ